MTQGLTVEIHSRQRVARRLIHAEVTHDVVRRCGVRTGARGQDAISVHRRRRLIGPGRSCSKHQAGSVALKLSVGFGDEDMVSNLVRPIKTFQSKNPADHVCGRPTGSRSLS